MRIQHNIMAMNAYRNYTNNTSALAKNLEKLSSGYRINRAGDDAAGLAISEKMRAQITALGTAQKNVKDGISLVKTAEGATQEIHDMLNRMVDLATQSANGTYQDQVDREAIENEFNALKTEINRIADSSNFNGIKLLDGKLGLNTDAFKISSVAAKEATDGKIDISTLVAKEADGSPKVHMEGKAATAAAPAAVIDLGDLAVTGSKQNDTLDINVGSKKYTLTATADDGFSTTAKIATLLAAEMNKEINATNGGAATPNATDFGGAAFTAAGVNGTVTLTFAGSFDKTGGTWQAGAAFKGDEGVADAINAALGADVTVGKLTSAAGAVTGDVTHKVTQVDQAVAAKAATKAGIDINLSDLVKDGNTLTIDGKTFFFKTNANTTATAGTTAIDVSAFGEDEWVHKAADLLSKQTVTGQDNRTWKIGVNGDGTTIHIDQTQASTATKELDTYAKLVGVISAQGQASGAKNAGTEITLTADKLAKGDTLTVLDGSKEKRYSYDTDFTDLASLKEALGKDGFTAEVDGDKLTVYAKDAKSAAPSVVGNGLTLQIGEDSEDYNQLSVAISDMHVKALGLDDQSLSTQESAQDAVQAIKNAINQVSSTRGRLGATQNRLEHTANNLSTMKENIQDAEATIRDTDIAEEMMAYTKNNILVQSAQAMLAQANQIPQGVLQLLG